MKKLFTIICFLLTSLVFAQNNMQIAWQGCYGSGGNEKANDILQTENGYLVFGDSDNSEGDIRIVRIDSLGYQLWSRSYGGSQADHPNNIIKMDNNYYFGAWAGSNDGDIQSGNHGGYDRWIVKINGDGDIIWEKCYGGSMTEYGGELLLLSNGDILTYAASFSSDGDVPVNYGYLDVWLMIISPDGAIVASEVFGNIGQNNVFDIVETTDGGFFMASKAQEVEGMVQGNHHGLTDVWAVKLDADLNIEWQKLYGGSDDDYGYRGVLELEDGYLFLASTDSYDGDVSGFHGGFADIWAVRIDLEGNIIWQKCLGGNGSEHAGTLHQADDGGFVIIGETDSNNGDVSGNNSWQGYSDIWMVKLNSEGDIIWQQCYGGLNDERINKGVITKSDNNWVIAGSTKYNTGDVDCNWHGLEDFWVFEIEDTTTNIVSNQINDVGIKVYPNPATDYVIFEFTMTTNNPQDKIIIMDVFGQEVARLPVKSIKTIWDTRNTQSGIYIYTINNNESSKQGKILLTK